MSFNTLNQHQIEKVVTVRQAGGTDSHRRPQTQTLGLQSMYPIVAVIIL